MLQGEKLERCRELAYRELERVEDEEILTEEPAIDDGVSAANDGREAVAPPREFRYGVPVRAITSEFEIPIELRPVRA
jgi:hypothetical protein